MNKRFIYGTMAMSLLFAGCNSDDLPMPDNGNIAEIDQTVYVSMRLSSDIAGTRAESDPTFADSNPAFESTVDNAYFVFYDEDGNVVGDIIPLDIDNTKWESEAAGQSVEKTYKSVVAVPVRKGEKKPSQVICYINPITPGTLTVNLDMIQTVTRSEVLKGTGDTRRFAMSNAVYYPEDEENPVIAVEIPDTQLHKSEALAEEALENDNYVTIHVERYATKLTFDATSATTTDYVTNTRIYGQNADGTTSTTLNSVELTFVPEYWALNAQANETYVIKSFREESSAGALLGNNYTFANLNTRINPADPTLDENGNLVSSTLLPANQRWIWNAPTLARSYWSMSPAYFTSEYPEVSSDVTGNTALTLNQTYLSYNDLAAKGFAATNNTAQYFRETTVGSIALASKNPAAAVASVIYVGKYQLKVNGGPALDNTDFYTYLSGNVQGIDHDRPYIYFKNAAGSLNSEVTGGESMLKRFLMQCGILYKNVGTPQAPAFEPFNIFNEADANLLSTYLTVGEVNDNMKQEYDGNEETLLKLQNNSRTLLFGSVPAASANIYIMTENGYKKIVADNATNIDKNTQVTQTAANIALMRNVGVANLYNKSHAYFNIPVKHLGWYRAGNEQKNNAVIDWNKVRVGDFGMVRNHQYSINVTNIEGLASGIGGDNAPIVPPATPDNYYVAYAVKILRWAVVPVQNVIL